MKTFFSLLLGTCLFSVCLASAAADAEQSTIPASPTDFMVERPVLDDLLSIDRSPAQNRAVDLVLAHPERFTPLVLYATARALFISDRKDEAVQWLFSAQLRGHFDAMRCPDQSAGQANTILLGHFGPPIRRYAFQSMPKLKQAVNQAVAWDRAAPHHYDHRWLEPHGIGVIDPNTPAPSEWEALAENIRVKTLAQFNAEMAQVDSGEIQLPTFDPNDPLNKFELNTGEPKTQPADQEKGCEDCVYMDIG